MPDLQHRLLSDYKGQRACQGPSGRLRIFQLELSEGDLDNRVASGSNATAASLIHQFDTAQRDFRDVQAMVSRPTQLVSALANISLAYCRQAG